MVDKSGAIARPGRGLGKQIAERRKAIEWTQEQLAERLGVDAETVSRFERGVTAPSLLTLERLARALKTSAAELLSESSNEPTAQAVRISAWIDDLAERDRVFVVDQVKRLCEHLRRKA